MKRYTILLTLIYTVVVFLLFGMHLLFLSKHPYSIENYIVSLLFLSPVIGIIGYILINTLLEIKARQDEMYEHIIKEVLHEINLPLATIEANTSMLKRTNQNPKSLKRIERIEGASKRLKRLYQELAYNIKKELMPIQRVEFDVSEVIKDRVLDFKEMQRNPISVDTEPLVIYADKIGFEQVVDNIIENAMKYSKKSDPISIVVKNQELKIIDNGIGMDESELLRVYERYYQGDRATYGEGIGLAIVKRYCDDENIHLRIVSTKGEGTTVILNFEKLKKSP